MTFPFPAIPAGGPSAPTDPHWANVKLLLGFDGVDGSTTFTDEGPLSKTCTAYGNAQIDTSQSKFGGASGQFDGTEDDVGVGTAGDSDFGNYSGPWTFECFVRLNATDGDYGVCGKWFNPTGYLWRIQGGNLSFLCFGGTNTTYTGWNPSANTWYHIVAEYNGTKTRLYVDGVMQASATGSQPLFDGVLPFGIGAQSGGAGAGRSLNGRIDEFRFTHAARYNSDSGYTVPTAAFPRG